MQLGDIWLKVARNEQLTPQEEDFFKNEGNNTQQRNAKVADWTAADGKAKFVSPYITEPIWGGFPMGAYTFNVQTDLVVANNTDTLITFDEFYQPSKYFNVDSADKQIIRIAGTVQTWHIGGMIEWAASSTGYRSAKLEGFLQDGTSMGTAILHTLPPTPADTTLCPFSFVVSYRNFQNLSYFKIKVVQTSGGNLTMRHALMSAFVV